ALVAGLLVSASAVSARADERTDDAWDLSQGTVITATSGSTSGSAVDDLLGGTAADVEKGTAIFRDGNPAGFVHFIEWRTPQPIVFDGFTLHANDDFVATGDRGFLEFRLYAKNADTGAFDLAYRYTPPKNPYGEFLTITAAVTPVVAQEFRAEFDQASVTHGGVRVRELDGPSPVRSTNGFLLPLTATARKNAKVPAKSRLDVSDVLDLGDAADAFDGAATLDVGGFHVPSQLLAKKGRSFVLSQQGLTFALTPGVVGSSRATFVLSWTGDLGAAVPLDGALPLVFADAVVDLASSPKLARGKFAPAKGGALVGPGAALVSA